MISIPRGCSEISPQKLPLAALEESQHILATPYGMGDGPTFGRRTLTTSTYLPE